jgi:hypothetical protein
VTHEVLAASDTSNVVLGLKMLMGIVQKPTLKSSLSRDAFVETPIFPQTLMTQDKFELLMKFLHFFDNRAVDVYTGAKKIFKSHPRLEMLNRNF